MPENFPSALVDNTAVEAMLKKNSEILNPTKIKDFVSRISDRHVEEYGLFDYN